MKIPILLELRMVVEDDRKITLSVNGERYCTYTCFSGEEPVKVATRAAVKLRETLYSLACDEVYHSNTFIP